MNIYWIGGEDIDFMAIGGAVAAAIGGTYRTGWARCSIILNSVGVPTHGNPFNGGALTTAWLTCRVYSFSNSTSVGYIGFGLYGTNNALIIGSSTSAGTKLALYTVAAGSFTQIATEAGNSLQVNTLSRFDIQVLNYGASATVNVYVGGVNVLSFTGNVAVAGMTNFDHVYLSATSQVNFYSEMLVADSNTLAITGVQTLALTGAGTTNNWVNNTYTNINGLNYSDSNPIYVDSTAANQQYTVTSPTPVTYAVAGCQISARMAISASSTPSYIKLGYGSGGVGYFGSGAEKTPALGFATQTQIDLINPVTGTAFTSSNLSSLQLDVESD